MKSRGHNMKKMELSAQDIYILYMYSAAVGLSKLRWLSFSKTDKMCCKNKTITIIITKLLKLNRLKKITYGILFHSLKESHFDLQARQFIIVINRFQQH